MDKGQTADGNRTLTYNLQKPAQKTNPLSAQVASRLFLLTVQETEQ